MQLPRVHPRVGMHPPPFRPLGLWIAALLLGVLGWLTPAAAYASPFTLLVFDSDGGAGSLGQPIVPSSGSFFRSKLADPLGLPPSPEQIAERPDLEFTSYAALGGEPSSASRRANPWAFSVNGAPFRDLDDNGNARQLAGIRANFPRRVTDPQANQFGAMPSNSRAGPLGPDGVFVARLTVSRGVSIQGLGVFIGVVFRGEKNPVGVRATLDAGSVFVPVSAGDIIGPTSALLLRSHLAAQIDIPRFGAADIYDLYVVSPADALAQLKQARTLQQGPKNKAKSKKPKKPKPGREPPPALVIAPPTPVRRHGPTTTSAPATRDPSAADLTGTNGPPDTAQLLRSLTFTAR